MLLEKSKAIAKPTDTLCEECSLKVSFRSGEAAAKIIAQCEQCVFNLQFEDEENVYEQKLLSSLSLACSYLKKDSCLLLRDAQQFWIVTAASNSTGIAKLQEQLGNLSEYAVIISSDSNAYRELTPFPKGAHFLSSEQFLKAEECCEWKLETPHGLLHVSPPRTIMELLVHSSFEEDLYILSSKQTDIHEWDLKMKYKDIVDYYLIRY